jgi:hypothetical protein
VDEGISILTGVPAGERDPDRAYPADSVNGRVDRKLRELAEKLQSFGQPNRERRNGENGPAPAVPGGNGPGPEGEPEPPKEPDLPGDQPEPPGPTVPDEPEGE